MYVSHQDEHIGRGSPFNHSRASIPIDQFQDPKKERERSARVESLQTDGALARLRGVGAGSRSSLKKPPKSRGFTSIHLNTSTVPEYLAKVTHYSLSGGDLKYFSEHSLVSREFFSQYVWTVENREIQALRFLNKLVALTNAAVRRVLYCTTVLLYILYHWVLTAMHRAAPSPPRLLGLRGGYGAAQERFFLACKFSETQAKPSLSASLHHMRASAPGKYSA